MDDSRAVEGKAQDESGMYCYGDMLKKTQELEKALTDEL